MNLAMKKIVYILALCVSVLGMGCSENENIAGGEGTLCLSVGLNDAVKVSSRALTDNQIALMNSQCRIRIYSGDNLIHKFQGVENLPSALHLISGSYLATAETGEAVTASFEKSYYKGEQSFSIVAGQQTEADLICKIQNTLVKVAFDSTLDEAFDEDYKVTIGFDDSNADNYLVFTKENMDKTGYFMVPAGVTKLNYYFTATVNGDETNLKYYTGSIENVQPSTQYNLTFEFEFMPSIDNDGGGMLTLKVNEEPIEPEVNQVGVYQRPTIVGKRGESEEIDLDDYAMDVAQTDTYTILMSAATKFAQATLTCEEFVEWGVAETPVIDLMTVDLEQLQLLQDNGLQVMRITQPEGSAYVVVTFMPELMSKITANEGAYRIGFAATDVTGGMRQQNWNIVVQGNTTVVMNSVDDTTVYTNRATVTATMVKEVEGEVAFLYRPADPVVRSSEDWTKAIAEQNENIFTALLTELLPNTTYEVKVADGENVGLQVKTFTTEDELQLENAGFEYFQGTSPILIYGEGQQMWWDSGNHGSSTLRKNVTVFDSSFKHGGDYSISLQSQFVGLFGIGKFAAGNVFVGKYLGTDGTDGIIGWGRPFTSRPKALHGYIRYISGEVNYAADGIIAKGDNDQGQIFVAVGDWAGETYNGEWWPIVIKTKTKQFFNPDDPGIIGYGEKTWTESTPGDGWVEFTIPLDYRSTRKPTHIILTCSASKFGDYFAGGTSTMWLDDLELIYE